jgi:hypothetical protein
MINYSFFMKTIYFLLAFTLLSGGMAFAQNQSTDLSKNVSDSITKAKPTISNQVYKSKRRITTQTMTSSGDVITTPVPSRKRRVVIVPATPNPATTTPIPPKR